MFSHVGAKVTVQRSNLGISLTSEYYQQLSPFSSDSIFSKKDVYDLVAAETFVVSRWVCHGSRHWPIFICSFICSHVAHSLLLRIPSQRLRPSGSFTELEFRGDQDGLGRHRGVSLAVWSVAHCKPASDKWNYARTFLLRNPSWAYRKILLSPCYDLCLSVLSDFLQMHDCALGMPPLSLFRDLIMFSVCFINAYWY